MNLYEFYQEVKNRKISFCYSGPIIQEGLEGVAQTLRKKLYADEISITMSQAIFSIFIEEMQNILNYSAERQKRVSDRESVDLSIGIFAIGEEDGSYFIYCGNQIYTSDVEFIKGKIEEVRHLTKEELRMMYKEKRKQSVEQGSKGAGLGLIEISRRVGKPMEYAFTPIDEQFSFFTLNVQVGGKANV